MLVQFSRGRERGSRRDLAGLHANPRINFVILTNGKPGPGIRREIMPPRRPSPNGSPATRVRAQLRDGAPCPLSLFTKPSGRESLGEINPLGAECFRLSTCALGSSNCQLLALNVPAFSTSIGSPTLLLVLRYGYELRVFNTRTTEQLN